MIFVPLPPQIERVVKAFWARFCGWCPFTCCWERVALEAPGPEFDDTESCVCRAILVCCCCTVR